MGIGKMFFKRMLVLVLTVLMTASVIPMTVMADGGNTYQQATSVAFGQKYSGSMSKTNDTDWYKLTFSTSGTMTLKFHATFFSSQCFLYGSNDLKSEVLIMAPAWDSSAKESNETYVYALNAGTYYLKVFDYNTNNTGTYDFTVSFSGSGESFTDSYNGSNNEISTACAVKTNTNYNGFFAYNDKADFYKFTLDADTEVAISVKTQVFQSSFGVCTSSGVKIRNTGNKDVEYITWNDSTKIGNGVFKYKLSKGTYYFFAERSSILENYLGKYSFTISVTGWQKDSIGWWYQNSDGSYPKNQFKSIGNRWYYFEQNGYMVTGWRRVGGIWYYFNSDGVMQTGWVLDGGHWYYFNKDGALQYGWQNIGGKYYYFKSDGTMAENEYCGGYWLGSGGAWTYKYKASWKKDSTGWWYGDDSGWYAKNETIKIDGKNYNFNASGYCTNP